MELKPKRQSNHERLCEREKWHFRYSSERSPYTDLSNEYVAEKQMDIFSENPMKK